jgi:hypothetical protein
MISKLSLIIAVNIKLHCCHGTSSLTTEPRSYIQEKFGVMFPSTPLECRVPSCRGTSSSPNKAMISGLTHCESFERNIWFLLSMASPARLYSSQLSSQQVTPLILLVSHWMCSMERKVGLDGRPNGITALHWHSAAVNGPEQRRVLQRVRS